MAFVLR